MVAARMARTIIGVIGNITSFFLFASPMPTFYRIAKKKSVEEFRPDPYIAAVMNCIFWIFYGLPFIHPDSTLVLTINSIGLALELAYLLIFFIYSHNKQRIILWFCAELVVTAVVAIVAVLKFHTHTDRSMFVGIFCVVFGVILYSSPLTIMRKVIKTKSVEFMPFWLSVAGFSNGVIWLIYALLRLDPYILTSNGMGAILGAAQLSLYAYYYKSTPTKGDEKKQPEMQQPSA